MHIDDPQFTPKVVAQAAPIPNVLVNQTGYFPRLPKIATVKSPDPRQVGAAQRRQARWSRRGPPSPFGADAASGDQVSIADFSSFTKEGTGYTLKVGTDVSHPFDIGADIYAKLKYDALAYFYHNRSGIEIEMPFAGDAAVGAPGRSRRRAAEQG